MRTTYYPDGCRGHFFHLGDIVRVTRNIFKTSLFGDRYLYCAQGEWGRVVDAPPDKCNKSQVGNVQIRLDGYSQPWCHWETDWYPREIWSSDLEPYGVPAGHTPGHKPWIIRNEAQKKRQAEIRYQGWTNAGTWMMALYLMQEPRFLPGARQILRKDGTLNPSKFWRYCSEFCVKLDDWVKDLPRDEKEIDWKEIREETEIKLKEEI